MSSASPREEPRLQTGPISSFRKKFVRFVPLWLRQMPFSPLPEKPDPNFQLVDLGDVDKLLHGQSHEAIDEIKADIEYMDYELMRLFRRRDHEAKKQQVRYQRFQLGYIILAAIAALIGSFQALEFASNPERMPVWSFMETLVALAATFLATISGRESPLQTWLLNRRRSETLRREYFRYIMRVPPYHNGEPYQQRVLLSLRVADINRGVDPRDQAPGEGNNNV